MTKVNLPPAPDQVLYYPFGYTQKSTMTVPTQKQGNQFSFTIAHGEHLFTITITKREGTSFAGHFITPEQPQQNPVVLKKIQNILSSIPSHVFQTKFTGLYERISFQISFPEDYLSQLSHL